MPSLMSTAVTDRTFAAIAVDRSPVPAPKSSTSSAGPSVLRSSSRPANLAETIVGSGFSSHRAACTSNLLTGVVRRCLTASRPSQLVTRVMNLSSLDGPLFHMYAPSRSNRMARMPWVRQSSTHVSESSIRATAPTSAQMSALCRNVIVCCSAVLRNELPRWSSSNCRQITCNGDGY